MPRFLAREQGWLLGQPAEWAQEVKEATGLLGRQGVLEDFVLKAWEPQKDFEQRINLM